MLPETYRSQGSTQTIVISFKPMRGPFPWTVGALLTLLAGLFLCLSLGSVSTGRIECSHEPANAEVHTKSSSERVRPPTVSCRFSFERQDPETQYPGIYAVKLEDNPLQVEVLFFQSKEGHAAIHHDWYLSAAHEENVWKSYIASGAGSFSRIYWRFRENLLPESTLCAAFAMLFLWRRSSQITVTQHEIILGRTALWRGPQRLAKNSISRVLVRPAEAGFTLWLVTHSGTTIRLFPSCKVGLVTADHLKETLERALDPDEIEGLAEEHREKNKPD